MDIQDEIVGKMLLSNWGGLTAKVPRAPRLGAFLDAENTENTEPERALQF